MRRQLMTSALLFAVSQPLWAARPLTVDDVVPVDTGRFQLEVGSIYEKDSNAHHFDFPMVLSYGLVKDLQVGVGNGGQFDLRENAVGGREAACSFDDVVLTSKWNPVPQERFGVALALAGSVKIPTADCDHGFGSNGVDTDLTLIATRRWGERLGTHLNVGYTWNGAEVDLVHYGVAADYAVTSKLSLVAEVFADTPVDDGSGTRVMFNGGVRFACTPDFTLDAAAGVSLRGAETDIQVTVGFTWLFDIGKTKH